MSEFRSEHEKWTKFRNRTLYTVVQVGTHVCPYTDWFLLKGRTSCGNPQECFIRASTMGGRTPCAKCSGQDCAAQGSAAKFPTREEVEANAGRPDLRKTAADQPAAGKAADEAGVRP
jgi:hypothetical protein